MEGVTWEGQTAEDDTEVERTPEVRKKKKSKRDKRGRGKRRRKKGGGGGGKECERSRKEGGKES